MWWLPWCHTTRRLAAWRCATCDKETLQARCTWFAASRPIKPSCVFSASVMLSNTCGGSVAQGKPPPTHLHQPAKAGKSYCQAACTCGCRMSLQISSIHLSKKRASKAPLDPSGREASRHFAGSRSPLRARPQRPGLFSFLHGRRMN